MSNSPLVNYTKISPHKNSPRNHVIDTITIHCYVGQVSVESAGEWFAKETTKASCNYVIGSDGRIGLIVDENDRSWCSSSSSNDNRAITIECASDRTAPYAINDKVYASLIELCADICKRNNIKKLLWKDDKSLIGQVDKQNMTVHRWFKNKDCPGEYIYSRLGQIASEVNAKLTSGGNDAVIDNDFEPFQVEVIVDDLNYRSDPSMNGVVKGTTGKGIFTIVEEKDGWGKLKSGLGWIWLRNENYCRVTTESEFKEYLVKVTADRLNVRSGPSTNYDVNTVVSRGEVFTIVDEENGWGELKSGAGWISLKYTKCV